MIKRYTKTIHKRKARVRAKLFGTTARPRLCVFRSLKHIHAQIIDDSIGKTLVHASDFHLSKSKTKLTKSDQAAQVGTLLAQKALDKKITKLTFDRGHYRFHGRVKALAEAAKAAGMEF